MISSMMIRNFKSIKNLNLNCKRINVFIGEPNSGKSNILEAIGLLSHLFYGKDLRHFVRLETMKDLFYDKVFDFPIEINFDNQKVMIEFKDGRFKCRLDKQSIFDYSYDAHGSLVRMSKFSTFKFYRFAKRNSFPDQHSEFLIPPYGENLLAVIITRKKLRASIKEIFDAFGYKVVFKPEEGKIEIQKELEDIIFSLSYPLVSETLQRIIFFLAAVDSNIDSVLAFEEPEAHAFPYYTKYLAERIALDKNKNQYFISTHNPYFLLSIIEKTPREELAVFLTSFKNYQTEVQALTEKRMRKLLKMNFDLFFRLDELLA